MVSIFTERRLPIWVSVPLVIVELVILSLLFYWLYLTRPVETYRIPEFIGSRKAAALEQLREDGVRYEIEWQSSLKTAEGTVLGQRPAPGERIKINRTVKLQVSRGAEKVRVPDLTGRSLMEVENQLISRTGAERPAGPLLNIGNIVRIYSEAVESGRVVAQDPEPGVAIHQGSRIDLLISRGSWPKTLVMPDLRGLSVARASEIISRRSLKSGDHRHVLETAEPPSVVLQQDPAPGLVVNSGQAVALTVNLSDTRPAVSRRKYTLVNFNPPPVVISGHLKVRLIDQRGERTVFDESVLPGEKVEFLIEYTGKSRLMFYWNEQLYRIRELEL